LSGIGSSLLIVGFGLVTFLLLLVVINRVRTNNKVLCFILRKDNIIESSLLPRDKEQKHVICRGSRYTLPDELMMADYPNSGLGFIKVKVPALIFVEDGTESLQAAANPLGLKYSGTSAKVIGRAYDPYAFEQFVRAVKREEKEGPDNKLLITIIIMIVVALLSIGTFVMGFQTSDKLTAIDTYLRIIR
jgi:hypothetical protein